MKHSVSTAFGFFAYGLVRFTVPGFFGMGGIAARAQ